LDDSALRPFDEHDEAPVVPDQAAKAAFRVRKPSAFRLTGSLRHDIRGFGGRAIGTR